MGDFDCYTEQPCTCPRIDGYRIKKASCPRHQDAPLPAPDSLSAVSNSVCAYAWPVCPDCAAIADREDA